MEHPNFLDQIPFAPTEGDKYVEFNKKNFKKPLEGEFEAPSAKAETPLFSTLNMGRSKNMLNFEYHPKKRPRQG